MKENKIIIIGDGETAEMAYEYLKSNYQIEAFVVESGYLNKKTLFSIPVEPLENIVQKFPNQEFKAFVAISYVNHNVLRERLYNQLLNWGYKFVNFIHPTVVLGAGAEIGDNCFILENVVIQRKSKVGNNVFIWSGSIVAHQTIIGDHVFIASGVSISGFCSIGKKSFLGVGSNVMDYIKIEEDCIIGGGAFINRDTKKGKQNVRI